MASTEVEKRQIDTYTIVSVVVRGERKYIFGVDEVYYHFFKCVIAF